MYILEFQAKHRQLIRGIRYVVAEAVDVNRKSLGQSKVVQTILPNRNAEIFVEAQEWLEKDVPSRINNEVQQTQEVVFQPVAGG